MNGRLTERLVTGLLSVPGIRIYGLTERADWDRRVATVASTKERDYAGTVGRLRLRTKNIFAWNGSFYAQSFSERMGVEESDGWLRLGLVHYNTVDEIDRCVRALEGIVSG